MTVTVNRTRAIAAYQDPVAAAAGFDVLRVNRTRAIAAYQDPVAAAAGFDVLRVNCTRAIAAYRAAIPVTFEAIQSHRSAVKAAYRYTEPVAPPGGNVVVICITS